MKLQNAPARKLLRRMAANSHHSVTQLRNMSEIMNSPDVVQARATRTKKARGS